MKILYLPNQYSQQRQFEKPVWIYPVLLAMQAEWYRKQGNEVDWHIENKPYKYLDKTIKKIEWSIINGKVYDKIIDEPENIHFLSLPIPSRTFTNAFDKKYQRYGNYKYHPATHMQVADGCWWGKCKFCVEKDKPYVVRPMETVMQELEICADLGFKEVFDDSGSFPDGDWLTQFCIKKITNKKIQNLVMGCNVRIDGNYDYRLMKRAGFRMVLFGVESANQITLNKINKGVKYERIIPTVKQAAEAGLAPHIAVMFGYPWEEDQDSDRTLKLVHYLLTKGYAKTAQASFYTTKQEVGKENARRYIKRIYEVGYNPLFWCRRILDIKDMDDFKYLKRQIKEGIKNV